jgi:hypothetical protein
MFWTWFKNSQLPRTVPGNIPDYFDKTLHTNLGTCRILAVSNSVLRKSVISAGTCGIPYYCTTWQKQFFTSGSCPILVLAHDDLSMVMGRPPHADAKSGVKKYQGPTTSRENMIRKHQNFSRSYFLMLVYDLNLCRYLNPESPPLRDFASLYFLLVNRHTFVCGTLFPGIKLNLVYHLIFRIRADFWKKFSSSRKRGGADFFPVFVWWVVWAESPIQI